MSHYADFSTKAATDANFGEWVTVNTLKSGTLNAAKRKRDRWNATCSHSSMVAAISEPSSVNPACKSLNFLIIVSKLLPTNPMYAVPESNYVMPEGVSTCLTDLVLLIS